MSIKGVKLDASSAGLWQHDSLERVYMLYDKNVDKHIHFCDRSAFARRMTELGRQLRFPQFFPVVVL